MKKLYTFLAITAFTAFTANAQKELVTNGGFEDWTDTNPAGFEVYTTTGATPVTYNGNITKETTTVHTGKNAVAQLSSETTQYLETSDLIAVTPGHSYTISYWYLDNVTNAKTRIWSSWLPATGSTALADDAATLRDESDASYSTDSPNWVQKTLTLTAPATATRFRFQARTYRQAVGISGGTVYFDDISVIDNSVAGVKQNQIADLKLFPNPLTGNVLNIATNNNVEKSVAVFDVLGKQVLNAKTVNGTVNTGNLTAGVYVVKITEEGKTATRKLIVQ